MNYGSYYIYSLSVQAQSGGVLPYISYIGMCRPSSRIFAPFLSESGTVYTLPVLVCNKVWFLRELRDCMNVQFQMSKREKYATSKWI